jgi:hypothetical protein
MAKITTAGLMALGLALSVAAAWGQSGGLRPPDALVVPAEPVETAPAATPAVTGDEALTLTPAQRAAIYGAVLRERAVADPVLHERMVPGVGLTAQVPLETGPAMAAEAKLPAGRPLHALPDRIVAEVPAVQPYRYVIDGARVLLLDPDTLQVVAEIGP